MKDEQQQASELLEIKSRRLHELEKRAAAFGIDTPPHIKLEIEDLYNEIARLKKRIPGGTLPVVHHPVALLPSRLWIVIGILAVTVIGWLTWWKISTSVYAPPQEVSSTPNSTTTVIQPTAEPIIIATDTGATRDFTVLFEAYAERPWQSTGAQIKKGDRIVVTYKMGTWTENDSKDGTPRTGPDGIYPADDVSCMPMSHKETGANALIAKIGDGPPFRVGGHYDEIVNQEGILYFRLNDCDEKLSDNTGILTLQININR